MQNIGVTIRREVSPTYAQDIERYLTFHRDLVKEMASRFDATLMAQGEVEEKKLVFGTDDQKEEAIAALKANQWASDWYLDETVEKLYRERMFYSDVVADYESWSGPKIWFSVIGCMAISWRWPMACPRSISPMTAAPWSSPRPIKIPSFDVFGDKTFRLEDYWDQSLFDKYNRAWYRDLWRNVPFPDGKRC